MNGAVNGSLAGAPAGTRGASKPAPDGVPPDAGITVTVGVVLLATFGFNGGGSYAVPINPDFSALGFGNLGLAFGDVFTLPITAGGGIRFDHLGPVQLSALLGFTVAPIGNSVGTKPGLGFGVMGNYPLRGQLPSLPNLGLQAQFMYHVLADSLHIWTLNFGVTYDLPY